MGQQEEEEEKDGMGVLLFFLGTGIADTDSKGFSVLDGEVRCELRKCSPPTCLHFLLEDGPLHFKKNKISSSCHNLPFCLCRECIEIGSSMA